MRTATLHPGGRAHRRERDEVAGEDLTTEAQSAQSEQPSSLCVLGVTAVNYVERDFLNH